LENIISVPIDLDFFLFRYYYNCREGRGENMTEKKSSLMLSFLIGGLIGGGMTFLLASSLMRRRGTKAARATRKWAASDDMEEQSYEEGGYCAPEGADMHYDMGKDTYYSNEE
jgi:hypothetical protein